MVVSFRDRLSVRDGQIAVTRHNHDRSWSLEIDYSRAPCLGADQKTRKLWERDWDIKNTIDCAYLRSYIRQILPSSRYC